ncbi:MAG: hypothetical protein EOM26_06210 [Alphaproteobacteria bacterium]|nr:hypothetical protein [Alphaproteobacteria bacterium]
MIMRFVLSFSVAVLAVSQSHAGDNTPGAVYDRGIVTSDPDAQYPEDVQEYWTEERMRNATPMERTIDPPYPHPDDNPGVGETPYSDGAEHVLCTAEAKLCPDGTAVSRTGPNCEFAPCPELKPKRTLPFNPKN